MITSTDAFIEVYNFPASMPYMQSIQPNTAVPGQVWYSAATNNLEVFDGNSWIPMIGSADIGLSMTAQDALTWATEKMHEEQEIKTLAENNKAVQIALNNLKEAENQLAVTAHLARKHEQTTS